MNCLVLKKMFYDIFFIVDMSIKKNKNGQKLGSHSDLLVII